MKTACAWLSLCLVASSGCALYFNGDDDPCKDYGGWGAESDEAQPAIGLRNPATGQCEYWGTGGGGGGPCNPECGWCTDPPNGGLREPSPTWGYCESECTGLGEEACLATPRCRGIYGLFPDTLPDSEPQAFFLECWQTDLGGQVVGDSCEGLDAWACSTHDDCVANHEMTGCSGAYMDAACVPGNFLSCGPEKVGCYGPDECGDGYTCNAQEVCLPGPACDVPGGPSGGCTGDLACYGWCVPDPVDPGLCYAEALCDSLPPECPENSLPGVGDNGCWTGYCIPIAECEPGPTCGEIIQEPICVARPDCVPLYQGVNCSCTEDACTCEEWLFESCVAGDPAP